MKITYFSLWFVLFLLLLACQKGNNPSADDVVTVDIHENYPLKELILQDIADIEYVALETRDDFITQGIVEDVSKNFILIRNRLNDGNIYMFDRSGKAIRKINRFGQGNEEYTLIAKIILDENTNELFILDSSARKIVVYDLYGNFKRSFKFVDTGYYFSLFDYDRNNLICYNRYAAVEVENKRSSHLIISKQDGSITQEIQVPFEKIKTPTIIIGDAVSNPIYYPIIPDPANWVIMNTSSDTVYTCLPDGTINPLMVRTPSIQTMEPEIFLFPELVTERFYFMKRVKKEYDFATRKGFPKTNILYDKQEKTLFEYIVYNNDFSDKREVFLGSKPINHTIATTQSLDAFSLREAYEDGKLKGRLKEITAGLEEESNPIILLIKHKNKDIL